MRTERLLLPQVMVALLATLSPVVARAEPSANDELEQARSAEGSLDYRRVITHATAALARRQNSHESLIEIYRLLGTANAVLGQFDPAVKAFTHLLAIEPDYKMRTGESPKIRRPFKEAGGYWMARPGGLKISADVPSKVSGGRPVAINIQLDDPLKMTQRIAVDYRRTGEAKFIRLEEAKGPSVTITIPASAVEQESNPYDLEVKVLALDAHGGELRLAGDRSHLISVPARIELVTTTGEVVGTTQVVKKKSTIHKKWWFWTAIVLGAGAVGAAAGVGAWYATKPNAVDLQIRSEVAQTIMIP